MKKLFLIILLTLVSFGLFAQEILYQKQHQDLDSITVVAFVESAENWYFISIIYADNKDAVDKFLIYGENKDTMQDLLFSFEKRKDYIRQINSLENDNSILLFKEETGIENNIILNTKHYYYMK